MTNGTEEFGIYPLGKVVNEAFIWRHGKLELAKAAALAISEKHNVEVLVYKILGSFKPEVHWRDCGA